MTTSRTPERPRARALVLDRYRLRRRLGSGGFGTVWLADDEHLERPVAIKVIAHGAGSRRRVEREARAAARLNHAGIVTLYEAGADDEAAYLVSELVVGETLAELVAAGALSDRDVLRIGVVLCDALAHAHAAGVVHRDVKPQNVMVPAQPERGAAKLTDFGIARVIGAEPLTRTSDVVGTLAYMAPEQAEGGDVDERADLYALGIVLYEALAGVNPIRAASPAETARRLGRRLAPLRRQRRDLDGRLARAIDVAVEPHPDDRGDLDELRAALITALPAADDTAGEIAPSLLERSATFRAGGARTSASTPQEVGVADVRRGGVRVGRWGRLVAGLSAGGVAAWAAAILALPVVPPGLGALVLVAALPRLGWLLLAVAGITAAGTLRGEAAALLVAAAAVPTPVLLLRAPALWSLPAAAPALALIGAAAAFPALAGLAQTVWQRAALALLGAWWLALSEVSDLAQIPALATTDRLVEALAWAGVAVALPFLLRALARVRERVGAARTTVG